MTANFLRKACLLIGLPIPCVLDVYADGPIEVHAVEQGRQLTGQQWLLHDPANQLSLHDAVAAWHSGQFAPLLSAGSTGLQPGAFWGWFQLHNPLSHTQVIHLEYIDHQLINLDAWLRVPGDEFRPVAQLSMERPFAHRVIAHNRFVIPVELPPQTVSEVLVRFGSGEGGYVYPSMRVWTPQELTARYQQEISLISFLFGGFFLMGVFALVAGSVSRQNYFYLYAVYAFSKIAAWATILGYTHQFLLRDNFHWSLMSATSAVAILLGLLFARLFFAGAFIHTATG